MSNGPVQPIQFVYLLRKLLPWDIVVSVDVGTVYIYMMRYFYTYLPRHLLCSNGQQTLGVGLPWAIAASLGGVDFVKFAEAFGATAFRVSHSMDLEAVVKVALTVDGVSIVDIHIDYSYSIDLMRNVIQSGFR